jgi:2'-hydroxyisoflavone reductase
LAAQKVWAWSDMPVWMPAQGETAGFCQMSIQQALDQGLTFRSLGETTQATLDWFRQQRPERQAKLKAGITAEREAEVLAAWHARK